jgi:hypothetical protein
MLVSKALIYANATANRASHPVHLSIESGAVLSTTVSSPGGDLISGKSQTLGYCRCAHGDLSASEERVNRKLNRITPTRRAAPLRL